MVDRSLQFMTKRVQIVTILTVCRWRSGIMKILLSPPCEEEEQGQRQGALLFFFCKAG